MTILPSKPKKTVSKGDRHGVVQSGNRPSSGAHSHHLNSCACVSSGADTRKGSCTPAVSSKLATSANQVSRGAMPKGSTHGSGMASVDCSKKPTLFCRDDGSGYNSDDEYGTGFRDDNMEALFEERLRRVRGFHIKAVRGDGACLFRAVADQVYGDEEMHSDVRRLCLDYMEKNRDHFSQFVTEDFDDYLARKRREDEHGNHVELQAISEIFSRPIEIYEYCTEPKNIFSPRCDATSNAEPNPPIRLSYHGTVHYNSVVDPLSATIGVGLGLPGYSPGAADRNLMRDALLRSEVHEIEEAMLKDKINMTDYERTEQEISEQENRLVIQVARESYMEYVRKMEAMSERKIASGAKRPQTYVENQPGCSRSPRTKIRSRDESQEIRGATDSTDVSDALAQSTMTLYEELIASGASGMSEWATAAETDADEKALLAQVMALSQQEFLDSLKHCSKEDQNSTENGTEQAGSSKTS
uniref:ubiquitinyl hydrolase 1 n=1 Tax=Ascaris suum TaxID=6253 RepID=F1KYF6_ASCSU